MLEFYEHGAGGQLRKRRISLGRCPRETAKAKADEVAAKFATETKVVDKPMTVRELFDMYEREVTPTKARGSQRHDRTCAVMFASVFGANRAVHTLNVRDVDRFVRERRSGSLAPRPLKAPRPVRDRQIQYDLQLLHAVLNWASLARGANDRLLIDRNPIKGIPLPREASPVRSVLTAEQYETVRTAAAKQGREVELAVVLAHETGHRIGSIRRLRWSDIDLDGKWVAWRSETDKTKYAHTTPLSDDAAAALTVTRRARAAIGDTPVFPSPADASRSWSRHYARDVWERLATRASLPVGKRYGWHSLRRQFASELKEMPLKDLCALGGWKSPTTVLTCYIAPDEATQRRALAQRKHLRASGLSGE